MYMRLYSGQMLKQGHLFSIYKAFKCLCIIMWRGSPRENNLTLMIQNEYGRSIGLSSLASAALAAGTAAARGGLRHLDGLGAARAGGQTAAVVS